MTTYANLHRFIILTTICTFLLIVAGGLVTSTQSGLSVPDWPTTYGHFMFAFPMSQMVGGIVFEHSHRMIASVVGFLTVIAALWLWRREDRRWVRFLGFGALGLVVAQGILGGLTVLFLLPTAISVSHATLAQTFFVTMASIAVITSRWWRDDHPTLAHPRGAATARLAIATALAIYVQLILGALMRHTESGLAVPDFPLAYGQLFPSLTPSSLEHYNQQLIQSDIRLAADGAITAGQIIIHMLHRIWAIVVGILVFWTALLAIALGSVSGRLSRIGWILLSLLLLQLTLGALTVLTRKAVILTTAHVATGALLLAGCVFLALHLGRIYGLEPDRKAAAFSPREVTA